MRRMRFCAALACAIALGIVLAGALAGCGSNGSGTTTSPPTSGGAASPPPESTRATTTQAPSRARAARTRPTTIARNLDTPWGVAFLPGGDALVAERDTGRIVLIPAGGGKPRLVLTVPGVQPTGEGGLLGLAVSPGFSRDRTVFAYFTSARDNRIVSFRLGESTVTPILTGLRASSIHNGGRIAFGPDGK